MNQQIFWEVIGRYNQMTWIIQIIIFILFIISLILKWKDKAFLDPRIVLGISNVYIGVVFEFWFGQAVIQKFVVAPLFIIIGGFMIQEGWKNRNCKMDHINTVNVLLFILTLLYPFASMMLGHSFPQMVLYIMPCPLVCLSILTCSAYKRTNKILMILLIVWGMTGIKSLFFNVMEDSILFICGVYGIAYYYKISRQSKL